MTSIRQIAPTISDTVERMVAEVLACADTDPERRREHRRAKVRSYPEEDRKEVTRVANGVLRARFEARAGRRVA